MSGNGLNNLIILKNYRFIILPFAMYVRFWEYKSVIDSSIDCYNIDPNQKHF